MTLYSGIIFTTNFKHHPTKLYLYYLYFIGFWMYEWTDKLSTVESFLVWTIIFVQILNSSHRPKFKNAQRARDNLIQKVAHTFSPVSVGMKLVLIDQAGQAKQRSKEVEFKTSYFWTPPFFNPLTDFHESYVMCVFPFFLIW